jgi:hypothetical protein
MPSTMSRWQFGLPNTCRQISSTIRFQVVRRESGRSGVVPDGVGQQLCSCSQVSIAKTVSISFSTGPENGAGAGAAESQDEPNAIPYVRYSQVRDKMTPG